MADVVALENFLRDAGVHAHIFDDTLRSLDEAGVCCVDDLLLFPTETDLESCGVKKVVARRISLQLARVAPKSPLAKALSIPLVVPDPALLSAGATPQARRVASKLLSSPPAPRQRALASAFDLVADDAPAPLALGDAAARLQAATRGWLQRHGVDDIVYWCAMKLQAATRGWLERHGVIILLRRFAVDVRCATVLQAATRGWLARRGELILPHRLAVDVRCATVLQAAARGWFGREVVRAIRYHLFLRDEITPIIAREQRERWRRSLVCYEVPESFWMDGADGGKTEKADVEANLPCLQGLGSEPSATHSLFGVYEPDYSATGNHGATSCGTTPRLAECGIVGTSHVPLGSSGLTARPIPATPQPTSRLAQLIAAAQARRRSPAPEKDEKDARGLFILDSHLPQPWRLETHVWAQARALPGEEALHTMCEGEKKRKEEGTACRWNDFFSRVLPLPGSSSCIHNEDFPELCGST